MKPATRSCSFALAHVSLTLVVFLFAVSARAAVSESREWTDIKGRKIKATLVDYDDLSVRLKMDGKIYKVPLTTLSAVDRSYIKSLHATQAAGVPVPAGQKREPDVIFVPTPNDVVDMMLHLARVKKDDVVYDLGCGDGRIVVAAAKKYGCKAVGYDIDPQRVKASLQNVKKNKVERLVTIEQKDIFTLDLRPASVITLYLLSRLNVKLIPQLEELRPGCRIVSHAFDMKGVKPDMVLTMWSKENNAEHTVYLWTTPLNKQKDEGKEKLPELPFGETGSPDSPTKEKRLQQALPNCTIQH